MSKLKKVCALVLVAAVVLLGLTCCKEKSEHPTGEHPTTEAATEEHPSSEHPAKEGATEEHPAGEHPK